MYWLQRAEFSREANSFLIDQEIVSLFWKIKFIRAYRAHKIPSLDTVLSYDVYWRVHTPALYFIMIDFNIILSSMSRSPKCPFSFRLLDYNCVCTSHLFPVCYMPPVLHYPLNVNLSLCLTNEALLHEGVWKSGCVDPHFLDIGTGWRWVVSFTPLPLYSLGQSPRYQLERR
jgi:hypothetical protein